MFQFLPDDRRVFTTKFDPFDKAEVTEGVGDLDGTVLPVPGDSPLLRIKDPDGNIVQLRPVQ